jgi:isoleucyl-tRNA synthetase
MVENGVDLSKELNAGHFMNKVMKDIYNRYHILEGYNVDYQF